MLLPQGDQLRPFSSIAGELIATKSWLRCPLSEMEWDITSVREAAHALSGANVVVIADDSGSMAASVRDSPVPPAPGIDDQRMPPIYRGWWFRAGKFRSPYLQRGCYDRKVHNE